MPYDKANGVIGELLEDFIKSTIYKYQIVLHTLVRVTGFIFDYVYLLHYKCHKINFKHCE